MPGNPAFLWADAFTGSPGQPVLAYDVIDNQTVLTLDVNGDSAADFASSSTEATPPPPAGSYCKGRE